MVILGNSRTVLGAALGATLAIWLGAGQAMAQAPVNAAPTVTAVTVTAGPALPTAAFIQSVASMDAFEQRAGKISQLMGNSLEVRALGKTMADDHAKNAAALTAAVASAQIAMPTADLSPAQTEITKTLYSVPARDFDRAYITGEVASHTQALAVAQAYASGGDNAAVKTIAQNLIPAIQRHLDQARAIQGRIR